MPISKISTCLFYNCNVSAIRDYFGELEYKGTAPINTFCIAKADDLYLLPATRLSRISANQVPVQTKSSISFHYSLGWLVSVSHPVDTEAVTQDHLTGCQYCHYGLRLPDCQVDVRLPDTAVAQPHREGLISDSGSFES